MSMGRDLAAPSVDVCAPVHLKAKRERSSVPPEGYTCKACGAGGHYIYDCPQKKSKKKLKAEAEPDAPREKPVGPPPKCKCGQTAVQRTILKDGKAKGFTFWWCAKKRSDPTHCSFSRPVVKSERKQKKTNGRYAQRDKRRKAKADAQDRALFLWETGRTAEADTAAAEAAVEAAAEAACSDGDDDDAEDDGVDGAAAASSSAAAAPPTAEAPAAEAEAEAEAGAAANVAATDGGAAGSSAAADFAAGMDVDGADEAER